MSTPHSTRPGDPGQAGQAAGNVTGQGYQPANQAGQDDRAGFGPDFAGTAWPAFMAAGLGAIVVGILLLAWPKATLAIVAILIGASLVVAGLLRLIDGFTAHDASGGRRVAHVLIGLLAIIVGLYCIRHYNVTIAALAIIVGLFWILHGIADIAAGLFAGSFPGRGLTIVAGRSVPVRRPDRAVLADDLADRAGRGDRHLAAGVRAADGDHGVQPAPQRSGTGAMASA